MRTETKSCGIIRNKPGKRFSFFYRRLIAKTRDIQCYVQGTFYQLSAHNHIIKEESEAYQMIRKIKIIIKNEVAELKVALSIC